VHGIKYGMVISPSQVAIFFLSGSIPGQHSLGAKEGGGFHKSHLYGANKILTKQVFMLY